MISRSRAAATNAELGHEHVEPAPEREESPAARRHRRERENHSLTEFSEEMVGARTDSMLGVPSSGGRAD